MSISVTCTNCGHQFSVSETDAGTESSCPECEGSVMVPEPSASSDDAPELTLGPEQPETASSDHSSEEDAKETDSGQASSSGDTSVDDPEDDPQQEQEQVADPGLSGDRTGEQLMSGPVDRILKSIPVGLKPDTLCISAAGMFVSTLVCYLFWILAMQFSSIGNQLIFTFIGLVLGLTVSFETFTALSRMSIARLRNEPVPEWSELVAFLSKHLGTSLTIPFGLLSAGLIVLILEYLVG